MRFGLGLILAAAIVPLEAAQATTYTGEITPRLSGSFDFVLDGMPSGSFRLTFDFDRSAMTDGLIGAVGDYSAFNEIPVVGGGTYWDQENQLPFGLGFHVDSPDSYYDAYSPLEQFAIRPTATGFVFSYQWSDNPCYPQAGRSHCSQLDYLQFVAFSGHGDPEKPISYSYSFGPYSTGGSVPEPAIWAMMILGFGLIGASLRQCSRRSGAGAVRQGL